MPALADLRFRALQLRALRVPLRIPLQTSNGTIAEAPMLLIDLHSEQGVSGHSYLFCYTPLALRPVAQLLENLLPLLGSATLAPLSLDALLRAQFRLLGSKGVVAMALAGLDMAVWDLQARALGVSLARLLGAAPRPIRAYNSCGLGLIGAQAAAAEAEQLLLAGLGALKLRLGYADLATDLAVLKAVRSAIGEQLPLMVDYNQVLDPAEAARRLHALDDQGLLWIEEPIAADDHAGNARLRRAMRTPLQLGENWWGPAEMAIGLAAGSSDLGMPDAMKIGGVSGWLRAAAMGAAAGLPLSSHLFPEISAQLLAATPGCDWLEYVDWADAFLAQPLRPRDGCIEAPDEPGSGLRWDEQRLQQWLA
jgi:mandelate racemase